MEGLKLLWKRSIIHWFKSYPRFKAIKDQRCERKINLNEALRGKKPLKILFLLGFPNPSPNAAWTRIGSIAEAWSKIGHSVEVLGAFGYNSFQKSGTHKIDRVNLFNLIFCTYLNHPLVFMLHTVLSFIVSMLFLFAKRPDLIIVSIPRGDIGLGALMACVLFKTKCVVDYRDEWEEYAIGSVNHGIGRLFYSIVKRFAARLYAKCKLVVAVTPNIMGALRQRGIKNVKLVPNGADIKTFKPLRVKKKSNNFTIFYSGGIGGYYRLDIAAKAVMKLVDKGLRNIKLILAGRGEVEKLLDLVPTLFKSGNIKYIGVIEDKAELAHRIAEADVGLIPYDDNPLWKNSLPAKFFEYCACGIPVVATAHEDSLLAKLIREYKIGVTSPPMDEEKLAEAIYWIYKNKVFRENAGKRARLLIEEKFDRNKIAEDFLGLIENL